MWIQVHLASLTVDFNQSIVVDCKLIHVFFIACLLLKLLKNHFDIIPCFIIMDGRKHLSGSEYQKEG